MSDLESDAAAIPVDLDVAAIRAQAVKDVIQETQEIQDRLLELNGYVEFLLDHGYTWGEDGAFAFPNGDIWHRSGPPRGGQPPDSVVTVTQSEFAVICQLAGVGLSLQKNLATLRGLEPQIDSYIETRLARWVQ